MFRPLRADAMTSPRTLLQAWQLKPHKRLGQNFLVAPRTAALIVDRSRLDAADVVVEIGAGLGALTAPLAGRAAKVYAVEKDSRITPLLRTELLVQNLTNTEILQQDFLKVDLNALARAHARRLLVFGNLPYNISSQILIHLIEHRVLISRAVLMFQKELARRLCAAPGCKEYGRITVMLQYCARVRTLAEVNAAQFYPKPGIDSEVLEIAFVPAPQHPDHDPKRFFQIVKAAFGKRRKTLRNALAGGGLGIDADLAARVLEKAGIDPRRRAETLSARDYVLLAGAWEASRRAG
jgi:16S rRNA (adenine1518-N6/adenine1519-N6)-dimethyltransferase